MGAEEGRELEGRRVVRARDRRVAAAAEAERAVLPHHLPRVVVLRDTSPPLRPPPRGEAGGGSPSHRAQL